MLNDILLSAYLITDGTATGDNFSSDSKKILSLIEDAVSSGISLVQLREKQLSANYLFELSRQCAAITKKTTTRLLINDRADIAAVAGADGVHLTSHSIPVAAVRENFPAGFLIGVSTHSRETALSAKNQGADLVTFGPVFETVSKAPYGPPQGIAKLREIIALLENFPVFALGGINASNYNEVAAAGAHGVAGISWFYEMLNAGPKV